MSSAAEALVVAQADRCSASSSSAGPDAPKRPCQSVMAVLPPTGPSPAPPEPGAPGALTWRAAHVATPRPQSRTKPSASWWRNRSAAS